MPSPDPTTTSREGVGWAVVVVLASLAAVAPIATDLYLPGFPELGTELGVSTSGVQLTLTAFLVGMAVGQLVMGPLSDRVGRRPPLVASAVVCVVAGAASALAPSLPVLLGARLLQGVAGAGGMVIGRAVITDLVTGRAAAKALTLVLTVGGVAPVLAPLVGGLLLAPVGWRGLLWTVTALCLAMLVGVLVALPESLPAERRTTAATSLRRSVASVVRRRGFAPPLSVFTLAFGLMMAYIAASPFVYRTVVGLSEVGYGIAFGVNAAALISAGWVSSRLVDSTEPGRIVRTCLVVQLAATLAFVTLAAAGAPTWTLPPAILVAVAAGGGILGNSAAIAMGHVRDLAGTGSALLGFSQFALGALVSPLVGLGGEGSALVPAIVMAACSAFALLISRNAAFGTTKRAPVTVGA
ncbi:DHA1 family bicyclomycin/chloramphenicol resistance-like MFS transporter [Humibacillus xanthopallidus]|uniref:DHA1 family bicyclomycin/chloramphenicol resistance-like MFS transporter n=1 Tax=Humibacillus xanthopallidus TaxID=412689 RepID=A0A543PUM8_9MICO|nr:multidrug effflux MFS transporter [Humibacillus xanthopallidus]TQN47787.1 DHA1 family bicyclomycin/chloramphenicol resistance-like MFS transporter [Humibacillus xanthopallidus]